MDEDELPPGFRYIRVLVSDREYYRLFHTGALLGDATPGAALRREAGLAETPYRFKASMRRMQKEKRQQEKRDEEKHENAVGLRVVDGDE